MIQRPSTRKMPQGAAVLMRRNAFATAIAAGLFALPVVPVLGATITVGGSCTLVNSIIAANTDTNAGGACTTAGSGADIIVLPANSTQTLTAVNNSTYGPNGLPVITSQILIQGNGSTIQRDSGAPSFRIFAVAEGGDLGLERTTVTGGSLVESYGGGILSRGGLTLDRSTVSGNTVVDTSNGGGIYASGQSLSLISSTVSGNYASSVGGGIAASYLQSLSLVGSTVSGNTSGKYGGGIASRSGSVTLLNSEVSDNLVGGESIGVGGGGIVQYSGNLSVTDSTISGNSASTESLFSFAGGVLLGPQVTATFSRSTITGNAAAFGGGIVNIGKYEGNPNQVNLANCTVSGNSSLVGGGIVNFGGSVMLTHSTITANVASDTSLAGSKYGELENFEFVAGGIFNAGGTMAIQRTIVSGNLSATGEGIAREIFNYTGTSIAGVINSAAFNVFSHSGLTNEQAFYGFTPGATDVNASSDGSLPTALASILNTTLADNGGPTLTHALPAGSPAVDLSAAANCSGSTDQRGVNRPKDGNSSSTAECDSGAFERGFNFTDTAIEKSSDGPVLVGSNLTYTLSLTNSGSELSSAVEVADSLPAGLNFVSATPSQGSCAFELGTLNCELGIIAGGGGTASISLVTQTTAVGPVTNTASFITDAIDSNANTDFDDDDTTSVLDDNPPTVRFVLGTNAVGEGAGAHSLTVQLSAVSGNDVSVPFTVQGTAGAADYSGLSASPLTIPAGSLSTTLNFNIVNDSLAEPDETLIFTLTAPTNATLGSPTKSLLTIKDNDAPPPDTTPNAFNFVDKKGVKPKTNITSNTITVGGLGSGVKAPIVLSNGSGGDASYSINGAAFRKTPATVKNGDKVRLRNKIPGNSGTATCTLSIGGVSDGWKITTSN